MKLVSRLLGRSLRQVGSDRTKTRNACWRGSEALEPRRLFTISVTPIPSATIPQGSAAQSLDLNNVFADNTTGAADLTYSAKSDNTTLIQTGINDNILTVTVAPNSSGFAHVTVGANAPDQSTSFQTFRIDVTPSADRTLEVPLGPGRRSFRFVQSDHTVGTINLSGPGTGTIILGGDNLALIGNHARGANQEVESITLTGTTAATQLFINGVSAKRGTVFAGVGNITSDGSIGFIRMRKVVLLGDMNIAGGTRTVNMDAARNGTIQFGQSIARVNLTALSFTDENFSTPAPISTVRTLGWVNSDVVPESFQAASITSIRASGSFQPGVQLTGAGVARGRDLGSIRVPGFIGGTWSIPGASAPLVVGGTDFLFDGTFGSLPYVQTNGTFAGRLTVPSLAHVRVRGNMESAVLNLTGTGNDLGQLFVRGAILNSAIVSAGNLGPISAEALQQSIVYAGVGQLAQGESLPTSASELSGSATIRSITLRPVGKVAGFRASDVAAASIGILAFGTTQVDNMGTPFGVAAINIGRLTARDLTNRRFIALSNINDATTLANQIAAQGINLQDLVIRVLS